MLLNLKHRQVVNYGTSVSEFHVFIDFTAATNSGKMLTVTVNSTSHNRNEIRPTVKHLLGIN
jgi:hypothetical protein